MMIDSVVAIVGCRHCERDHLTLDSCQVRRYAHEMGIQLNMMSHREWVQRMNSDDVIDHHLGSTVTSIRFCEYVFSLFVWNVGNVCQRWVPQALLESGTMRKMSESNVVGNEKLSRLGLVSSNNLPPHMSPKNYFSTGRPYADI